MNNGQYFVVTYEDKYLCLGQWGMFSIRENILHATRFHTMEEVTVQICKQWFINNKLDPELASIALVNIVMDPQQIFPITNQYIVWDKDNDDIPF
mgnify:FL=1